jgi:glycosyltransferase involved in cell wall biosynthesis
MNIVVDIRDLMSGRLTGVEIYTVNLLKALSEIDNENNYFLYTNAYDKNVLKRLKKYNLPNFFKIIHTRIPNKILNLSLALFEKPKIDKIILKHYPEIEKIDVFFMPDLRPVSLSKNVKLITTFHDLAFLKHPNFFTLRSRIYFKLLTLNRLIKNCKKIISVSNFTKDEIINFFPKSKEKIKVIYEGPGTEMKRTIDKKEIIDFRKRYRLTNDFFLCLASINPRKNFNNIIKAFRIFKSQTDKKIDLIIAGGINTQLFPENIIDAYDDIRYIGMIDEIDKEILYLTAKAFINVSFYEGFGLTILEAFQCGTPVICSNSTALGEIAKGSAILVDPNNIFELTESMNKVLNNDTIRNLRKKALKKVNEFGWKKCADETLKIFKL